MSNVGMKRVTGHTMTSHKELLHALFAAAFGDPANPATAHCQNPKKFIYETTSPDPADVFASVSAAFAGESDTYVNTSIQAMERLRELFSFETGRGGIDALSNEYNAVAVDLANLYTLGRIRSECSGLEKSLELCTRGLELTTKLKTSAAVLVDKSRALTAHLEALADPLAKTHAYHQSTKALIETQLASRQPPSSLGFLGLVKKCKTTDEDESGKRRKR